MKPKRASQLRIRWPVAIANVALILLILGAIVGFKQEKTAANLVLHLHLGWIAIVVVLQAGTYLGTGAAWDVILRRFGVQTKLLGVAALGIEKLFIDQLVPTLGVGGSLMIMHGLIQRGVKRGIAAAAMAIDSIGYLVAYFLVFMLTTVLLYFQHDISFAIGIFMGCFTLLLFVSAAGALLLALHIGETRWPPWLRRFGFMREIGSAMREAPEELQAGAHAAPWTVLFEALVFVLDAATLWAVFHALGAPISPIQALVSFMLASAVAAISIIPGGVGFFEGSAIAVLHTFGASFATAVAGVVLLRAFTYWLPMLPGYLILRYELVVRGRHTR